MTPEQLNAAASAFLADARKKAAGGLTVAEFDSLVLDLLKLVVSGLESVSTLDGPAKKAWALAVVGMLFDGVSGFMVPIYFRPFWAIVRPVVREFVLAFASRELERILAAIRAAAVPVPVEEKP